MMKTMIACLAIAGTTMSASAQELLAWWSFNNNNRSSDLLNETGDDFARVNFGHCIDNNDPFDDGHWDPATDRLYPVSDFFNFNSPGALIDPNGYDPGVGIPDPANYGAWIDVNNLVGDNSDTQNNNWLSFQGTDLNMPFGSFAGGSLAITGSDNNGSSFDIVADLTGWANIQVSWAQRGTATGYNSRIVSVSTDGVNFTPILTDLGSLSATFEFRSASAGTLLDNASNAIIRFTIDGATSSNGNNRFDNIVLEGEVFTGGPGECLGDIADDFGFTVNDGGGPDGVVDFGDFVALLGLIGACPGGVPGCLGDIADDFGFTVNDGGGPDGAVDFGDFVALLGLIGPCPQ